ncbi:MAG: prepilin peptidase [Fusobacterium sp.]|nr:prepilin peptidase [Fusobacterium sp.]
MDTFMIAASIFVLLTGLCFGSFLNVVVLRAFSGESISYPASKCPTCQKPLYWWHNIPLLSYLLLGGKCYFCKTHISWQYPLVEAITGILFLLAFLKFGMSIHLIFLWAVIFMSLVLAVTDIKEHVVFLMHCLAFGLIGLIYHAGATGIMALTGAEMTWLNNPLTTSVLGLLLGGAIMLVYFGVSYVMAGGRMAMGDGDIYIAMAMGACYGWQKIWIIIVLGFLIQALITGALFEYRLLQEKNYKLFGGILAVAILAIGYGLSNKFGLFEENVIYLLGYTIVLIGVAVYVCRQLFGKVLGSKTEGLAVPFGPALVLAGFVILFFPTLLG